MRKRRCNGCGMNKQGESRPGQDRQQPAVSRCPPRTYSCSLSFPPQTNSTRQSGWVLGRPAARGEVCDRHGASRKTRPTQLKVLWWWCFYSLSFFSCSRGGRADWWLADWARAKVGIPLQSGTGDPQVLDGGFGLLLCPGNRRRENHGCAQERETQKGVERGLHGWLTDWLSGDAVVAVLWGEGWMNR